MQAKSKKQSSSIARVADIRLSTEIEPKESKESATTSVEPQNTFNLDCCSFNLDFSVEWKIFFRIDYSSVALINILLFCQPTRWLRLYNLFEKLYDFGARKVILDGALYCAHFNSDFAYQHAFEKLSLRFLKPLELVKVPDTRKIEVDKKMDQYKTGIPWCLNQELDLCCYVVKIEYKLTVRFMEMSENILEDHECIFIKSLPGEIWIGFPNERICNNSKKTVYKLFANLPETYILMAKPSNKLLESINLKDLVGDAYNLAYLARQKQEQEYNEVMDGQL